MVDPGLATIIAPIITAIGGLLAGGKFGGRGKKRGLGKLPADINIDKTTWVGSYEDIGTSGEKQTYVTQVKFRQFGSRIVGDVLDDEGSYTWSIEGLVHRGKICYVYVANNRNIVSTGAVTLELGPDGKTLRGQWAGWSPEGVRLEPQTVSLKKM